MNETAGGIGRKPPKIVRLARMRRGDWLLLVEATITLAIARLIVTTRPPGQLASRLGRPLAGDAPPFSPIASDSVRAGRVGWAIRCAAANVPFRAMCFEQALAARAMLDRRGIPGVIHYGVAPDLDGGLLAHAWTDVAGQPITGYPLRLAFREIARFVPDRLGERDVRR